MVNLPQSLIDDIQQGRCVAFVGAGFSAEAKLPQWTSLIRQLAETPALDAELAAQVGRTIGARSL